jgi:ABC-type branched-subunit amino acid transport system substrate-binding protein
VLNAHEFAASNIVRVGILLPLSGSWPEGDQRGKMIAGAAMLAVQDVNSDLSLLDGKELKYSWEDSGCGSLESMVGTNKILLQAGQLDAIIGPACSSACESSAYLLRDRAVPQVSFGCTESSLIKKYPTVCNQPQSTLCISSVE